MVLPAVHAEEAFGLSGGNLSLDVSGKCSHLAVVYEIRLREKPSCLFVKRDDIVAI